MHDAIEDAVREYFHEESKRKMLPDKKKVRHWLNRELSEREIWSWLGGALLVIVVVGAVVWKTL